MKLREYANLIGVSYRTAWQMFHEGNLPAEARQCKKSGSIIILISAYGAVLDAARALPKSDQERLIRELEEDRERGGKAELGRIDLAGNAGNADTLGKEGAHSSASFRRQSPNKIFNDC